MTVFLCGFMGCGKSAAGRELAVITGRNFIDMDEYIEKKAGKKIPEIFAEKGEEYFRELETEAVKELSSSGAVVACGGGAMLKKCNAEEAAKGGKIIYLEVTFDVCYERIKEDKNRPIVMNNTREALEGIYNDRISLYEENSDITIRSDSSPRAAAEEIKKMLKY